MATYNQRAIAICDALVNGTSTADQRQRVLAAYGTAENFVREVRRSILGRLSMFEGEVPMQQARNAVEQDIATDFIEAP